MKQYIAQLRSWLLSRAAATLFVLLLGLALAVNLAATAPLLELLWWGLFAALALPVVQTGAKLLLTQRKDLARYEAVLAVIATGIATWVVWAPLVKAGHLTDTKDHHVMLERSRELVQSLWSGKLQYYTHLLQGGDALWDLYPVLPSLLVGLVDGILPSRVSFEQSYTIVTLGAWTLRSLAVYGMSRRVAGVLPAVLVTVGSQLDVGLGVWDSTWSAAIHWGLVHSSLGVTFAAFAATAAFDVARKPTPGRAWLTALWVLLALLCHPLAFFYIAFCGACFTITAFAQRLRWRRVFASLGAVGLGGLLAGWYFLPYSAALSSLGVRFAWPGDNFGAMGIGMLAGQKPFGDFGGFYGFAALACCASLASRAARRPGTRLLLRTQSALSLVLFCLMLSPLAIQAQLFELLPPLRGVQPPRLFTILKVSLVPAMAWGLEQLLAHVKIPSRPEWRPTVFRSFAATLLIFGIGHTLNNTFASLLEKLRDQVAPAALVTPPPALGSEVDEDLNAVMTWIAKQRASDPSPTPFRMATIWNGWDSWGMWWFPWRVNVPLVHLEALPGNFLKFRPQHVSSECLSQWNVRYVVLRTPTPERRAKPPFPELVRRYHVGRLHVFELRNYDSRYVIAGAPTTQISGLKVEKDRIEFDVSGAKEPTPLVVRSAWFPRWQARVNGNSTPITQVAAHAGAVSESQIGLLAQDGHVVLTCDGLMPLELPGRVAALVGAGAGLTLSSRRVRRRVPVLPRALLRRMRRWFEGMSLARIRPAYRGAALVALALALIVASRRTRTRQLRLPGILGNNVTFTVRDATGPTWACAKTPFSGTYVCGGGSGGEPVYNRLGRSPGNMGEFPPLWPGIGVTLPPPGRTFEARFERIAPGQRLLLKYDASLPVTLEATYQGVILPKQALANYWGEASIDLPQVPGEDVLTLRFAAEVPGVQLVFSGETR